jgi:hypothetical protein
VARSATECGEADTDSDRSDSGRSRADPYRVGRVATTGTTRPGPIDEVAGRVGPAFEFLEGIVKVGEGHRDS